jgi:hypothetical protein
MEIGELRATTHHPFNELSGEACLGTLNGASPVIRYDPTNAGR